MIELIALGIVIILAGLVIANYRSIMLDMIGQLIQGRPEDYSGWCYYGSLLEKEGYYLQAYNAFKRAVTLAPTYTQAWKGLGDVLTKMGDHVGAAEAYRFSDT